MKFGSLLFVLCLGLIGCGETGKGSKSTYELGYEVFVSNYPLGYMVSELTSGEITPDMPWAGQGDPAYWKPSEEAVSALQESKLEHTAGSMFPNRPHLATTMASPSCS